ncbi:HipA domain-containing protein [Yokenella regensburgei]
MSGWRNTKVAQENEPENSELPEQGNLFELEFNDYTPSGLGTVHLSGFAVASDEMEYAVKGTNGSTPFPVQNPTQVPAAEWFCTCLAEKCGIATPVCKVLRCIADGNYVFGSRIEHAAWKLGLSAPQWLGILTNASDSLKRQLWAIYAFDQFVHNIDRHLNNYLYMHNSRDQVIVKTFDFSLSSFVIGWPRSTALTLPTDSTTVVNWNHAKQMVGDTPELRAVALNILDKIDKIGVSVISDILSSMPEEWLPPMHKEYILRWWDSEDKAMRLEAIRQEIMS